MLSKTIIEKDLNTSITIFNKRLKLLYEKSRKMGWCRLTIFLAGISFFLISFFYLPQIFIWVSIILSLLVFGIVTSFYNKIDLEIKKVKIWIDIKEKNLARLKLDWANIPLPKINLSTEDHPFENDLNISGKCSLHQLIDTSSSFEGSLRLNEWLTAKEPDLNIILQRQQLLKELIPLTRFRNKLKLNADLSSKKILTGENILSWLELNSNQKKLKNILTFLFILIPVNVLFLLLNIFSIFPAYWSIGLLIQLGIYWFNSKEIKELSDKSNDLENEFGKFSRIFEFLEKFNYGKNEQLKKLCHPFYEPEKTPSFYFKRIHRITFALSFQRNPHTMLILNLLFPYDFFFAYKLNKVKEEISHTLPKWLDIFYELEALISISNFAYLNPEYTFPDFNSDNNYQFFAENISHPLLPLETKVSNNFSIKNSGEIIIITGSNMSGKSTFLKTIGLNLSLAFAGGVVSASKLNTNLFRIFTCIKINDSVTDGISYFYAEVKRLKQLLNEIKNDNKFPLFYLIDEIFRGTNNFERLIGSRSFIKALAGLKGIGMISTHDLELVNLQKEISGVINYHFREDIKDGRMIFDYKLREGPSPTTNALKIMKLEGLPVED